MTNFVSDEENIRRYTALFEFMKSIPRPDFVEWWNVENTGWSGGTSWFSTGGTDANPRRFSTEEDAKKYALEKKQEFNDANTLWRYVHTTVEHLGNKTVTTEIWTEV